MIWKNKHLSFSPEMQALWTELNAKTSFPPLLVNLLWQRGFDSLEKTRAFMQPDISQLHSPHLFKDMDRSVSRILSALRRGEGILIYGDYDVDGTSSVTLMKLFFADWGLDIPYYIPDRDTEGYGISYQGVDYAKSIGAKLILTLDCGAKAKDKIHYSNTLGIDVIVVDHHTVGAELPPCHAMVNPHQPGCPYPFKELPACGLALKLAQALAEHLPELGDLVQVPAQYDAFDRFRDLVTLSIASDIVPLVGENRVIAHFGLKKLQENPLPGIAALMKLSEQKREWLIEDLVFFIGPRINSAGRLYSAREAVELLMGKGPEINQFASDLHDYNKERKQLEDEIHQEARTALTQDPDHAQRCSTVLWNADWRKGVIGIVASRLIERHYRPTILLTKSNGKWVGSARSVTGFDLYAALEACSQHLVQFGGHKYAAGLTLEEHALVPFREAFEAYVADHIQPDQKVPVIELAGLLPLHEIKDRLLRQIRFFGPFGPENTEPIFLAENVEVKDMRVLKDAHLRLALAQGGEHFEAIGFGLAWRWKEVEALLPSQSLRIDIAFQPDFKTYNGKTGIQLKLKDLRPAKS